MKHGKAIPAVIIRGLKLAVLLSFFIMDFSYWISDKFLNCDVETRTPYCKTKVNYTAHLFGTIAGLDL